MHRNKEERGWSLTEYSMVPFGLWNDIRLPSFFSGVFFCPVSESKRGKVLIMFMFRSPLSLTQAAELSASTDGSSVNSECERAIPVSQRTQLLSLSLSTPCLPPSFPHCLSLFLSRSAQWQPMYLHLAMPPAAANTVTDRDHPDLYEREKETERCSAATWHYHICFVLWFFVSLKWILILM